MKTKPYLILYWPVDASSEEPNWYIERRFSSKRAATEDFRTQRLGTLASIEHLKGDELAHWEGREATAQANSAADREVAEDAAEAVRDATMDEVKPSAVEQLDQIIGSIPDGHPAARVFTSLREGMQELDEEEAAIGRVDEAVREAYAASDADRPITVMLHDLAKVVGVAVAAITDEVDETSFDQPEADMRNHPSCDGGKEVAAYIVVAGKRRQRVWDGERFMPMLSASSGEGFSEIALLTRKQAKRLCKDFNKIVRRRIGARPVRVGFMHHHKR